MHTANVVYLLSTPHARATAAPASASLVSSEDEAFDVVTNVVSVDYLARPLELFQEM